MHPGGHVFLTDQISFSYFCRGSPNNHFYQIIFNSDHWFQKMMFKVPYIGTQEKWATPRGGHVFLTDQVRFSYFLSKVIQCKSLPNCDKPQPQAAMFFDRLNFF